MRSHKEKRATIKNAAIQLDDEKRIIALQKSTSFKTSTPNGHAKIVQRNSSLALQAMHNSNNASSNDTGYGSTRKKRKKRKLPRFPQRPESLVTVESIPERIQQLEDYLYNLLNISLYRNHQETVSCSWSLLTIEF